LSPQSVDWISGALSGPLSLPRKIAFPAAEICVGGDSVRMLCQWDGKPSISRCLDHSAGKSVRRATPMPYGSLPSTAALTRSGARKASEIVMLTFRTLQSSRFAMLSVVMDAFVASSSSQRRPRAIAATNVARVSERIGRANCGRIPTGRRNSRRRIDEAAFSRIGDKENHQCHYGRIKRISRKRECHGVPTIELCPTGGGSPRMMRRFYLNARIRPDGISTVPALGARARNH